MWIRSSCELTESICHLTTAVSSHLLIRGEHAALVDSSIAPLAAGLKQQVEENLDSIDQFKYLLLTHTHFDHIGGIAVLREIMPEFEVVATPAIAEKLKDQELLEQAYNKNVESAEAFGEKLELSLEQWVSAIKVDKVLGDGDSVDLGFGVEFKCIFTPGHTEESCAYYVSPDAAIQSDETLGAYYGRDSVIACFASSYQDYIASVDKLSALDLKFITTSHTGTISGELIQKFLLQLRMEAERFSGEVRERIAQGETAEEVSKAILSEWVEQNYSPEGPFKEEQESSLHNMVMASTTE